MLEDRISELQIQSLLCSYIYFEKPRLRLKRQKSKMREKMEEISAGLNINIPTDKYGAWIGAQESGADIRLDKLEFGECRSTIL
jgi:hypothetical protein